MSSRSHYHTLLLKTKSKPRDPYDEFFRSKNVDPIFVPVMEHQHINLEKVKNIISHGQIEGFGKSGAESPPVYGGVIITSQRAVEALGAALDLIKGN